jgi:hypothetical protein
MTPEQKALSLIEQYKNKIIYFPYLDTQDSSMKMESAIDCALTVVDETLKVFEGLYKPEYTLFDAIGERQYAFDSESSEGMNGYEMIEYYQEVKEILEKLLI